jgi:homopolymeric O-antigen transport system ATP-binding protein
MASAAILVENLSKRYLIGHQSADRARDNTLRDAIVRAAKNILRRSGDIIAHRQIVFGDEVEEFWALRDVSFTVQRGEVLGIIGRNGAGKSTLLKILSRITEPTNGRIRLRGRVASLLEVGTGFNSELTGRENIYLNGAILGMLQAEIKKKFDEIVAFAEVERFLDTPVKRYSSGMYVRLAFAVAAHLEPEILVVDEVLAVGDAEFQKKCLGKMNEVSRQEGRTVLFVSHNMGAVRTLCDRGIVLNNGHVLCADSVENCIREYEHTAHQDASSEWNRSGNAAIKEFGFTKIVARVAGSQPDQTLELTCSFDGVLKHRTAMIAFYVSDVVGTVLMQVLPEFAPFIKLSNARKISFSVQLPPLVPGQYWITAWVGPVGESFDNLADCVSFDIRETPTPGRPYPHLSGQGILAPRCTYQAFPA